jgi:hypothetical protein
MPTITLREVGSTDPGFDAELIFEGRSPYPLTITNPFASTPTYEELLEWYFEEWIKFPFTDRVLKQQAEAQIAHYGQNQFEQVFGANLDAYSDYRELRDRLNQVQIQIEGRSPEFQALHWEAMKDPDLPRPLAVDAVMLRKPLKPQAVRAVVNPSPVINLLVVTSRPDEEKDVGYRTISRPLIEAIQTAQLRVKMEILRPGTFEALARHLADKQGFYHIIHFDVHGALATYEQIQKGIQKDRYMYLMNFRGDWGS